MRIEKNTFVDNRYIASQPSGDEQLVASADTPMEAITLILKEVFKDEPVRGMCYHIDCDEDRCRCWSDVNELRAHLKGSRDMQLSVGLNVEVDRDRVVHLKVIHVPNGPDDFDVEELHDDADFGEPNIDCECNDPSCVSVGREGEVAGHIENCSCHHCHHEMGKLR